MRVVILGAGSAIPAQHRSPAGIYVRLGREHVLLDAGAGTLQRLSRLGVTFLDVDRIFLTHLHPDHCLDLVSFLFAMRLPQIARTKTLTLYGPKGLARLYRRLNTAFGRWIEPRTYRLVITEIGQTRLAFPGYTVSTKLMRHSTATLGYRFQTGVSRRRGGPGRKGKSIAYSGDTDVCDNVVELGRNADAFILECSVPDEDKVKGHLTPSECARIADAAGASHLVLSHFYPLFHGYPIRARIRRYFRGGLTLARDFSSIEL